MNEMIEKLKDKNYVRAFGLMEETLPGSQECFRKVGKENCLFYSDDEGGRWQKPGANGVFAEAFTYVIKPDYQPKPEFVDLQIVKHEQGDDKQTCWWLGVWKNSSIDFDFPTLKRHEFLPYEFTHLHCLPSLPNFHCFWYKDDTAGECEVNENWVSRERDDGKTVYARFRT